MKPLRIGIIGMGGFAATHHDVIARLESSGEFHLVCTCDPRMADFTERRQKLQFDTRGVRTFTDYLDMLDTCRADLDVVTIPTPIPLHAPMHRACVDRGLAVYLEKPPTLDYAELEQMIGVDSRARKQTVVGFNFIVEPERQSLKKRMVAGEFGPVQRVEVFALWPRATTYFARADWAGRLMKEGRLVLDSCIGNAMAHQVHNGLFWCGTGDPWAWGELTRVTSELYRGHDIEGLDTAFIDATTRGGVALRIAMSHACHGNSLQEERIVCTDATLHYHIYNSGPSGALCSVAWNDGRKETSGPVDRELVSVNFRAYAAYLRGDAGRPATRLVDCRPFVQLNNLAYIAAGKITPVPAHFVTLHEGGFKSVEGIGEAVQEFVRTGAFPSARSYPWSAQGGTATPDDLPRLSSVVQAMAKPR